MFKSSNLFFDNFKTFLHNLFKFKNCLIKNSDNTLNIIKFNIIQSSSFFKLTITNIRF